jgi:hypothetical protein
LTAINKITSGFGGMLSSFSKISVIVAAFKVGQLAV